MAVAPSHGSERAHPGMSTNRTEDQELPLWVTTAFWSLIKRASKSEGGLDCEVGRKTRKWCPIEQGILEKNFKLK